MRIEDFDIEMIPMPGAVPAWRGAVDATQWRSLCQRVRDKGGRLVALWGSDRRVMGGGSARGNTGASSGENIDEAGDDSDFAVHAALIIRTGLVWLTHGVTEGTYPGIADIFPPAERMQRALGDLLGIRANDQPHARPWLRHGAWAPDQFPLRKNFDVAARLPNIQDNYAFVRVEGDGVHEIPVGPVHAGTIEPGHFRFSILGERVLRLEERLGYTHKGIEKRFEQMTLAEGARLAGRISGDSTVAYAWAYAMAVEGAAALAIPARAACLRALLLERERIANHLGDLGFLGNDAGFAFGLAQFSRLKEDLLRTNAELLGHRYLMDLIVPGGVARDLGDLGVAQIGAECDAIERAVLLLHKIYDDHAGLQDRFMATGYVTPELADRLGLCGLAGRASGQAWDARAQFPPAPYGELGVRMATQRNGDVAARVLVRFDEIIESLRLCRVLVDSLPQGEIQAMLPDVRAGACGAGWVEGWRGEVFIALETDAGNRISRVHAHDPSWQNWPVLEHAVIGNIVPDFPLINKSFNLSYSGHDL